MSSTSHCNEGWTRLNEVEQGWITEKNIRPLKWEVDFEFYLLITAYQNMGSGKKKMYSLKTKTFLP